MTSQAQNSNDYFDLHITGIGYLNRVRKVNVKRGESFWACDIAALHGHKDDIQSTRFDCKVSGSEAEKLVERFQQVVDENKKVLIGFKLGDLYAETFVYEKGDKKGLTGVSLKSRLLFVGWVKVDGEMVYKAEPKNGAAPDGGAAEPPTTVEGLSAQPERAAVAA